MINIIVIDTNIFRALGPKFFEKIDYLSLEDYCYSSASEIIVPETVIAEFINYYDKEIIQKNIYEIEQAYSKLLKLNKFENIEKPDLKKIGIEQLEYIENKLTENRIRPFLNPNISENELVNFLIENKQENKKDNTRDYIIWTNTLEIAENYRKENVILISNDKIFKKNESFQRIKNKRKIKNLSVFDSIANFLSIYGFKSEKLTKELIIKHIPVSTIKKELEKDKNSIPSYISQFYYFSKRNFKLEKFEIQNIEIEEFYSHKDPKTNEIKVIVHVNVKVLMIFEPEKNLEKLNDFLNNLGTKPKKNFYPNSFDKDGRPIFDDWILFHFGLVFNENKSEIEQMEFYDFFPQEANFRRIKAAHNTVYN
jgi:hypothetical protein